jgi:hypothetical protein
MSDSDSRNDTLFTMVVVAQTLRSVAGLQVEQVEDRAEQFRDDRAWLDRLASRYLEIPMRSTVLDPASSSSA